MLNKLTNDIKTDRYILEQTVLIHILEVCLSQVGKDGIAKNKEDQWNVNPEWVTLLDQECAKQLEGLPQWRQINIARQIDNATKEMMRSLTKCSTYREASLVTAITIVHLTENMKIESAYNQGSMISALIIDENREDQDWGNYFQCQQISWQWMKEFQRIGLFV